ncbi:MAG: ABC transporter substrate-binding protein [Bacteroidales bacterium]|nr:ABC transporter substrate-binding protein [Bacteroidales bacterium]
MKKILVFLAAAATALGCSQDRDQLLKVYNWSDYIDESVIPEFEAWYQEQTGESVKVIYQTFDINETMLSKIEKGHEDFDVVCPSDYIIERMLQSGLLLPIDRDFGNTPNYIDDNMSPFVSANFGKFNGGGLNAADYAVGNMWGTTGILYNAGHVDADDAQTWDIIRNGKYTGKIFIKDSARDVYSQIIFKVKEDALADGSVTADELMFYTGEENLALVEKYMGEVKPLVAGWEADFGKDQMVQEIGYVNLTWSGDAVWAIEEAAEVGVELEYALPKEGFTVWFDGWVIPKYAKNTKAAKYWINFMNRPDIVIRNSEECGYVACSGSQEVMEAFVDEEYPAQDLSYFFGEGADSVHVNPVLYPDRSDIERSSLEHDWGENTEKLIQMWSRVKGDNASSMTVVVIGLCVVALIVAAIVSKRKKASRKHGKKRR